MNTNLEGTKTLFEMRAEIERTGMYCSQSTFDFYKKIIREHPELDTGRIDHTFDKFILFVKEIKKWIITLLEYILKKLDKLEQH